MINSYDWRTHVKLSNVAATPSMHVSYTTTTLAQQSAGTIVYTTSTGMCILLHASTAKCKVEAVIMLLSLILATLAFPFARPR